MVSFFNRIKRIAREIRWWIWWSARIAHLRLRSYFDRFWRIPTVRSARKILSTFCAEAAVLIAVFPYLEFLIASRNIRENPQLLGGAQPIDMRTVTRSSAILCVLCLISAVVLAVKAPDSDEED